MTSPALARKKGNGRVYQHPVTGAEVPSVTTVLNVVSKPALPYWAAKAAAEYAARSWKTLSELSEVERVALIKGAPWRESEAKADLGTAVHDAVDAWCTDRYMPEWAPGVAPFMEQFVAFLGAREPKFMHNEATVWSHKYGYAGTLDFIAGINSRLTICDVKSGRDVYSEASLQLAALANADCILRPDGTEEPLPPCELAAVLHLRPRSWALIPVNLDGCFDAFLAALELFCWQRDVAPSCLGARLTEVVS